MSAFKIPKTPSMFASTCELADYLELLCFVYDGEYSINEARKQIAYISDEDSDEGIVRDDDRLYDSLQAALGEIDRRSEACGSGYPFTTNHDMIQLVDVDDSAILVYKYLLLATRLDMCANKIVDGVDGTLLFEELSAIAIKNYFGFHAESLVFGTGVPGGFKDKIENLIQRLNEGRGGRVSYMSTNDEKDGGLDVVAWKEFSDKEKGKLIGFGQCKTGTEWRKQVGALSPDDFCKTYFLEQPVASPVKLFFVAESFRQNWEMICRNAGILFERCRIIENIRDFGRDEYSELRDKMSTWVDGNMKKVQSAYILD